ncbi:hypothetical protein [Lonsdalea britannica]|uniref:hypothetical protein n=1 Tax=Lonsdalea britannica TaxID=1082704 RepID=UPI0026EB9BD9|nr:hypothetical protein [Lonsdalea britannica]
MIKDDQRQHAAFHIQLGKGQRAYRLFHKAVRKQIAADMRAQHMLVGDEVLKGKPHIDRQYFVNRRRIAGIRAQAKMGVKCRIGAENLAFFVNDGDRPAVIMDRCTQYADDVIPPKYQTHCFLCSISSSIENDKARHQFGQTEMVTLMMAILNPSENFPTDEKTNRAKNSIKPLNYVERPLPFTH